MDVQWYQWQSCPVLMTACGTELEIAGRFRWSLGDAKTGFPALMDVEDRVAKVQYVCRSVDDGRLRSWWWCSTAHTVAELGIKLYALV